MPTYQEEIDAALNDMLHAANRLTPAVASKDLSRIFDCFCEVWQSFNIVSWIGHKYVPAENPPFPP